MRSSKKPEVTLIAGGLLLTQDGVTSGFLLDLIFQNRRLDQTAVLKYERHRVHEFLFRDVFHINTTDFYHSALGIKESGNQVGKGCFSTAGWTYKSYRLSCRNGQ